MAVSASALCPFASAFPHCNRIFLNVGAPSSVEKRFSFACFSSKKKQIGFMDQILDYIEGGPKLRKWYGAPDLMAEDANELEEDEASEEEEARDAVLITDGDNEIGQMIILALIVKRVRVKALVKDKRAAMEAFGTYVEVDALPTLGLPASCMSLLFLNISHWLQPLAGDAKDGSFLKKAFRGVHAVICPTEGFLCNIENWKGIQHVILLSQLSAYRGSAGIQAVMNSKARKIAEQDENTLKASGVSYTIIRTGTLKNTPGGQQGFSFTEGSAAKGSLSKGDAALVCVEALDNIPEKGLIFEVVNGEDKILDWKKRFTTLMDRSAQ